MSNELEHDGRNDVTLFDIKLTTKRQKADKKHIEG